MDGPWCVTADNTDNPGYKILTGMILTTTSPGCNPLYQIGRLTAIDTFNFNCFFLKANVTGTLNLIWKKVWNNINYFWFNFEIFDWFEFLFIVTWDSNPHLFFITILTFCVAMPMMLFNSNTDIFIILSLILSYTYIFLSISFLSRPYY